MDNDLVTTTFPSRGEFDRAVVVLEALGADYGRIDPSPPLAQVAVPALVMDRETRSRLVDTAPDVVFSGWVEHRPATAAMPEGPEPSGAGACFARAAIMVLQPCVADETEIRLVAHVAGNLAPALPYLNTVILCGEMTCMAFALRIWSGRASVRPCTPVFLPEQEARKAALLEICAGLGLTDEQQ